MDNEKNELEQFSGGLANRLFFRLYQCANMLHKTGSRALDDYQITTQQWAIIGALARDGFEQGISVNDLAAYLMVSRQNLAIILTRLEKQNYIQRSVDAHDNRFRRICLTNLGRDLWFHKLNKKIADYYAEALAGFSPMDQIHAIHYLDKILNNLKNIDPDYQK